MSKFMDHLENPETGLTRMVEVGDRVEDSDGRVWNIIKVDGGIAFYDKLLSKPEKNNKYDCFIAKFGDGTFNRIMTLR